MLKHISSCVLGCCSNEQYANSAQMNVLKHLHMRIHARPCTADTEVVLAVQSCAAPHLISLFLDFFSSKPSLHLHHMKGPDLTIWRSLGATHRPSEQLRNAILVSNGEHSYRFLRSPVCNICKNLQKHKQAPQARQYTTQHFKFMEMIFYCSFYF